MEHILLPWRGTTYHAVSLTIFPDTDQEEEVIVSTEDLEEVLLPEIKNGVGEAIDFDNEITYYVAPEEIKLPEEQIREIVENAVS